MSSARFGNRNYAGPTLQEGMEWVDNLKEGRGGNTRVLMERYQDKQGRYYICVAVQYWRRTTPGGYEGQLNEELRVYGDNHVLIGAVLMKLATRLDHRLSEREREAERQAHF